MEPSEFASQVIRELLPVAQLLVITVVGWVGRALTQFIMQRVKNERVAEALGRMNDTVWDVVLELEQTLVRDLKAAMAPDSPGGARVTAEEAAHIKSEAILRTKALLGPEGVKRLMKALDLTSELALDAHISTKVEAAVMEFKLAKGPVLEELVGTVETTKETIQ